MLCCAASSWRLQTASLDWYIIVSIFLKKLFFWLLRFVTWFMAWSTCFLTVSSSSLSSFPFFSPAVLLHLAGKTSSACTKTLQLGFSSPVGNAKACELIGKHHKSSANAFTTAFTPKSAWSTVITGLRSSLPPNRLGMGPLLGSFHVPSSYFACRATASSGTEPSGQISRRLQRARNTLATHENILDSFLSNNYRPSSGAWDQANFDLKKMNLEINVAKAQLDVAQVFLDDLKEGEDTTDLQIAKAER